MNFILRRCSKSQQPLCFGGRSRPCRQARIDDSIGLARYCRSPEECRVPSKRRKHIRHDIRLRHLPPNLYGLYVDVTEAKSIDVGLRLVGLETDLRDGLFRRATKTRWGQNEGRS